MKLLTKCIGCKEDIKVKSYAKTRPDLERDLGESFSVTCNKCHRKQSKEPNEVRAVENPFLPLLSLIIGAIITIALWNIIGVIGTITFGAPMLMWGVESNAVSTFNRYRL